MQVLQGEQRTMLEKLKEGLLFEPLTEEEKQRRGILGRLYGPIASFKMGTRNGRLYSEDLWEKVFENDIVKELLAMGGIPGEIQHPVEREETDTTKIAVMMPEAPKKDKQGHLMAYFDIVDTPCGKIAAALAKYGFRFGVSSRGTGDIITDNDGNEAVDPNTYMLNAWDLVLIPACADARMTFQESYNPNSNKLKTELFNDINNASEEDQKVMVEALDELAIDYIPQWARKGEKKQLAEDIGSGQTQKLQSLLKENVQLKAQVKELNAKLSVGYAQENERQTSLNEALEQSKANQEKVDELEAENTSLKEGFKELKDVQRKLTEQNRGVVESQKRLANTTRKLDEALEINNSLREELENAKKNVKVAQNTANAQKRRFDEQLAQKDARIGELENTMKKDAKTYKDGIDKAKELVETYKKRSNSAIERYISIKANMIGVSPAQIKQGLGETYTFGDIDRICEGLVPSLQRRNSLPFNITAINVATTAPINNNQPKPEDEIFSFNEW